MSPLRLAGSLVLVALLSSAPGAAACTPAPTDYTQIAIEAEGPTTEGFSTTEPTSIGYTLQASVHGIADGGPFTDQCTVTGLDYGTVATGEGHADLGDCATNISLDYTRAGTALAGEAVLSRADYVIVIVIVCGLAPKPFETTVVIVVKCGSAPKPPPSPCGPFAAAPARRDVPRP